MPRPQKNKTDIGRRLAIVRERMGHQQRPQFAKILGVSKVTLGNYERGDRKPTVELLMLYADKFNANLHWLLLGEGEIFAGESKPQTEKDITAAHLAEAVILVKNALAGSTLAAEKKAELVKLAAAALKNAQGAELLKRAIAILR